MSKLTAESLQKTLDLLSDDSPRQKPIFTCTRRQAREFEKTLPDDWQALKNSYDVRII